MQASKKCIQIDFSEYTLFLNTLVKFEFTCYSYLSASIVIDISLSFSYQVNVA